MEYLTTKQAAKLLKYKDAAQIRKLIQRGKLHPEKLGKSWAISIEELRRFQKTRKLSKK